MADLDVLRQLCDKDEMRPLCQEEREQVMSAIEKFEKTHEFLQECRNSRFLDIFNKCLRYREEKAQLLRKIEALEKNKRSMQGKMAATKGQLRALENRVFGIQKLNQTMVDMGRPAKEFMPKYFEQPFSTVSPKAMKTRQVTNAVGVLTNTERMGAHISHSLPNEPDYELDDALMSGAARQMRNTQTSFGSRAVMKTTQSAMSMRSTRPKEWSPKLEQELRTRWKVERDREKRKISNLLWRTFFAICDKPPLLTM